MNVLDAAAAAPASVPAVPLPPPRPVRFTGSAGAYWRLLIRGAVLLAITLGIYRFWLATDVRRFLWAHTEVAGESLEYTGTAVELLLGFLIAIAIIVPLNVAIFLAAFALGMGEASGIYAFLLLAFLGQYAVYRARRYRLTRTVFRGVRFHQTGSAWRYAVCSVFWWALIALTIGLAYPFAQAALERFKMRHTHYGNLVGRFEGSGFNLFLRGLPMWLLVIGPLVLAVVVAIGLVDWTAIAEIIERGGEDRLARIEGVNPGLFYALVVAGVAVVMSVLMAMFLFPVFQALVLRWWLSGIRLGDMTVRSTLRTGPIYGAYARCLLYGVLLLIAVSVVAGILLGVRAAFRPADTDVQIWDAIATIVIYVIVMLGFSTIYQATVKFSLWRHGVESIAIDGLAALDQVQAAGAPGSPVGEGLADALNVGGF
jgi:uncharacterized membrane protein YjgN (DUF898 family)